MIEPKYMEIDFRTLLRADKEGYGHKWFYDCFKRFLYSCDQVYPRENIIILYKSDYEKLFQNQRFGPLA